MPKHLLYIAVILLLVLSGACFLYSKQIFADQDSGISAHRNVDGTVTFTVKTATYNGAYAPRNAGVIWITNAQNQFVKTIKVWAIPYRYTLVRWNINSGANVTGAITGASINTHQLHTVTWNAKNYQGVTMPDGNYNFNVEFTEHNANNNNMGKYKTLAFAKGSSPINTTYPDETYFKNMSLNWQPLITDGVIAGFIRNSANQPIQGATITVGSNAVTSSATGSYTMQIAPGTYSVSCAATGYNLQTHAGITVVSNQTTNLDFTMLQMMGTISGVVKTIADQPISGAVISVGNTTATSSATGTYSLALAPDNYSVTCVATGYQPQTQAEVVVGANQTTSLNFVMSTVSNDDLQQGVLAFTLHHNTPNPFKVSTAIGYSIAKNSQVSLRIYNLKGQMVRELVNSKQNSGSHSLNWDGKLANGKRAESGMYIYKLSVNGKVTAKTLTILN